MENMLNVNERAEFDNTVSSIETHSYIPFNQNFNNSDEIRITIQQSDLYLQLSNSYLYIEGTFLKEDGSISGKSKLVNNGMAFLFDELRYEMNSCLIDKTKDPGFTSVMKGYVSLSKDSPQTSQHTSWSTNKSQLVTTGHFNFCVPLKSLLGIAEDFNKILINAKHELILIRARSDANAFEIVDNEKMVLTINKIVWKCDHIKLNDVERLHILKTIEMNKFLQVWFRSWDLNIFPVLPQASSHVWNLKTSSALERPRYVIIAFQTNRKNKMEKNASVFDHCDIRNLQLTLNSEIYPYGGLNINYDLNQYSILYDLYAKFQESYYHKPYSRPLLNYDEFKSIAPFFVLDCSRQNESIKSTSIDVKISFDCRTNIDAETSCLALILHDRIVNYNALTGIVKTL